MFYSLTQSDISNLVGNPRVCPGDGALWRANGFCNKGASLGGLRMQLCKHWQCHCEMETSAGAEMIIYNIPAV